VDTHFHGDHTGANHHFPASVDIVAQADARRRMLEHSMVRRT
jgi:glyoxylase-like metal-dependent hydrolase (beta-lactamase superfamily II)